VSTALSLPPQVTNSKLRDLGLAQIIDLHLIVVSFVCPLIGHLRRVIVTFPELFLRHHFCPRPHSDSLRISCLFPEDRPRQVDFLLLFGLDHVIRLLFVFLRGLRVVQALQIVLVPLLLFFPDHGTGDVLES